MRIKTQNQIKKNETHKIDWNEPITTYSTINWMNNNSQQRKKSIDNLNKDTIQTTIQRN